MLRRLRLALTIVCVTFATAYGAYVYVELPAPYKPEDIKAGAKNAEAREAARRAVLNARREKGELDLSYVGVLTYEGVPITPDADELLKERSLPTEDGPHGEITYVKGSGWPFNEWWLEAVDHINNVHGGGAYGWLKTFYGNPFFDITVSVSYDDGIWGSMYIPALNEIVLGEWGGDNSKGALTHEMAHSFRDDWTVDWDHFEEGMVEAVESAVQNVLYAEEPNYGHLWHHSRDDYYGTTCYEYFFNHNMPGLACNMKDFTASFCADFIYYRYGIAGMAWWKVFLQERFFLRDFNAGLWWLRHITPWPSFSELKALACAAYYGGPIEGLDFPTWFEAQPIFNDTPPLGDDMLLVAKDDILGRVVIEAYVFERTWDGGVGHEYPLAGEAVGFDIQVEPSPDVSHRDTVSNQQGYIKITHGTGFTEWVDHRVRVAATEPKRPLSRVEFGYVNHQAFNPPVHAEVYGVTTGALAGTVTLTPIDSPGDPAVVPLQNGGFRFDKFPDYPDGRESGDGRFLVSFDDGFGGITSKTVNKDAAEYFVVLNDLDPSSGTTGPLGEDTGGPVNAAYSFSLSQNYPNPCGVLTNFPFSLPTTSEPEFAVFDLAGRKMLNVSPGRLEAGDHSVSIYVSALPPGIYVLRITVGPESAARKFVVAR